MSDTEATDQTAAGENPLEGLVQRLQEKVAARKLAGEYPEELMEQLDEHFLRMASHRPDHDNSYLFRELASLDVSSHFHGDNISLESSMPGGARLHGLIQKAVSRQTEGIYQQMQQFADDVRQILNSVVLAVQDGSTHTHADLVGRLDSVLERLNSYERAPGDSAAALGDLRRRLEELERAEAARDFKPWFTNDAFEENFRGSREELNARYVDLAGRLVNVQGPVVDFGCGRGEFMELLRNQGNKDVWGIEIDPALADLAGEAGFTVEVGDGMRILANCADESLGAISLIQVIEHLTQQQQLDLISFAHAKLKPGGILLIETVNPQSLYVYAHAFYLDPTHTRPVHPQYIAFLQEQIGFHEVALDWRNPPPLDDQLEKLGGDPIADRNVERLNQLLFAPSDYATIATK